MRRDHRIRPEVHKRARFIQFRMKQYRLDKKELEQARRPPAISALEKTLVYILVAGEARRVTDVVGGVMQDVRLTMAGNGNDPKPQERCERNRTEFRADRARRRMRKCRHVYTPCRHTRRRVDIRSAGLLARGP